MAAVRHCKECHFNNSDVQPMCSTCDYCTQRLYQGDIHLGIEDANSICENARERGLLEKLADGTILPEDFASLLEQRYFNTKQKGVVERNRHPLEDFAVKHFNQPTNPAWCNCPGLEKHGLLD
jgi:hypothetical protein